jgi:hypothetical protein
VDSDFGRIARQQRFLKEMVREAADIGVLANPVRLVKVIDAAASSLQTDPGLGLGEMRELAVGMRRLTAGGLEVFTVPGESVLANGVWYVQERPKAADKLYASFRTGAVVRNEPPPPPEPLVAAKPTLTVINGTDRQGLAEAGAAMLQAKGYTIAEVETAEVGGLERTRILHAPALAAEAAQLARLFPGADVIEGVDSLPLTVKLGGDQDPEALASKADKPGKKADAVAEPTYQGAEMTDVDC